MTLSDLFLKLRYLLYVAVFGRYSKRPYHCQFQVTRRCNLRCRYCCVWRDEWGGELSLKEIELLAGNLRHSGLKSVVITGGEPLLRDDIVDVIGVFKRAGLIVRLQTNGILLTSELSSELFKAGLDDVYVSLDTLRAERFIKIAALRDDGAHQRLIENIKMLSSVAKRHRSGRFLLTVITPDNHDEVEELVSFAGRWGYLIGLYGVETSDTQKGDAEIRVSGALFRMKDNERILLKRAFQKALMLKKKKGTPIFNSERLLRDYVEFYGLAKPDMHWHCRAGRHYLVVLPDGKVSVCNGTAPVKGYDYQNLPELYRRKDREDIFSHYRMNCSGCICTRQLEYLLFEPWDMVKKTLMYLGNL